MQQSKDDKNNIQKALTGFIKAGKQNKTRLDQLVIYLMRVIKYYRV